MTPRFTFPKFRRLTLQDDIEQLFADGSSSRVAFPLRVVYRRIAPPVHAPAVLVSVSKRHLRHAVDRNRAKRQVREAFRLHQQLLFSALGGKRPAVHIAFVWLSDSPQPSSLVARSMQHLLRHIARQL